MRISDLEKITLLETVKSIDNQASVYLFGSRTDDQKNGGDIDIALLSDKIGLKEKVKIKFEFFKLFGEQKLDVVVIEDEKNPFWQVIKHQALLLT